MSDHGADAVADEAATWLARGDRGLTAAERAQYEIWISSDPRHRAEMTRLARAWSLADSGPASADLRAMAGAVMAATAPRPRRAGWGWGIGFAAAAAVLVAVALWRRPGTSGNSVGGERAISVSQPEAYTVVPASIRERRLPDGSVVDLREGAEIGEEFSAGARRVTLRQGEAHFAVAHEAERPFTVLAGNVAVRDVGTAFDVRSAAGEVVVLVTRGVVAVEDARTPGARPLVAGLTAGERATILLAGDGVPLRANVDRPDGPAVADALTWRTPRLVFDRTPLAAAVEAFNRHGAQRLVVGDPALADRRLGGTFRADNVEGFVRLLHDSLDVRSERRADGAIVLLPER